jgi:hypothetical protein
MTPRRRVALAVVFQEMDEDAKKSPQKAPIRVDNDARRSVQYKAVDNARRRVGRGRQRVGFPSVVL